MKRFIITFLLCLATYSAYAQYADVRYKLGHLRSDGEKLSKEQVAAVLSQDAYQDYLSGRRVYKAGVITTSVGAGIVGASGLLFGSIAVIPYGENNAEKVLMPLGIIAMSIYGAIAGGVVMVAGIPCLCVGDHRLRKVAGTCEGPQLALSFGPTTNGIGLGLSF